MNINIALYICYLKILYAEENGKNYCNKAYEYKVNVDTPECLNKKVRNRF